MKAFTLLVFISISFNVNAGFGMGQGPNKSILEYDLAPPLNQVKIEVDTKTIKRVAITIDGKKHELSNSKVFNEYETILLYSPTLVTIG